MNPRLDVPCVSYRAVSTPEVSNVDRTTNIKCLNAPLRRACWLPSLGQARALVVLVGERREAGEEVAQVCERLVAVPVAGHDDSVDQCHALASLRVPDERPVPHVDAGGPSSDAHAPR